MKVSGGGGEEIRGVKKGEAKRRWGEGGEEVEEEEKGSNKGMGVTEGSGKGKRKCGGSLRGT